MAKNSFLHPVDEIHFGMYLVDDAIPALKEATKMANQRIKAFVKIPDAKRTYENTVQAYSDASDEVDFISGMVDHLSATLGEEWHAVESTVNDLVSKFYNSIAFREDIYMALKYIKQNEDALELSPPKKRLIKEIVQSFERNGILLPKETRKTLKAISNRLSALSTKFQQEATKAGDKAHLILKNAEQLAGVDPELIKLYKKEAEERNKDGYFVQFSPPNAEAILVHCEVRATRHKMHKLSRSRAPKNQKILSEILDLRQQHVSILGYENYAAYNTETKMIKTAGRAYDYIKMLANAYLPAMEKEFQELKSYVEKHGETIDITDTDGVELYYATKRKGELLGIDESDLRDYFQTENVMATMFSTIKTLYGYDIRSSNAISFHPDCKPYDIYDENGKHLATVWADLYARKGKRAGAWMHGAYAPNVHQANHSPYLGYVVCNFAPALGDKPSLMSIREVETIWHEFGHFIHYVSGRTELREQNGYHCKWDFIEAPSQIMENWVLQKEILQKMAIHYLTGENLSPAIISKLQQARNYQAASKALWTINWSVIDLELHMNKRPDDVSPVEYFKSVKMRYTPIPPADYDISLCTFLHIFGGGYAAGYYGYKWAEAIEADLFSRFEKEGLLNPATGRDYRDKILARGDEEDPEVLIKDFLGRDFSIDAMLRRDKIST